MTSFFINGNQLFISNGVAKVRVAESQPQVILGYIVSGTDSDIDGDYCIYNGISCYDGGLACKRDTTTDAIYPLLTIAKLTGQTLDWYDAEDPPNLAGSVTWPTRWAIFVSQGPYAIGDWVAWANDNSLDTPPLTGWTLGGPIYDASLYTTGSPTDATNPYTNGNSQPNPYSATSAPTLSANPASCCSECAEGESPAWMVNNYQSKEGCVSDVEFTGDCCECIVV